MRLSPKPLSIASTDLKKLARERRTIVLTILLPVIVVIVVGTTFSLGYQEFESKELVVGVIKHSNSSYYDMLLESIRGQGARAIVYRDEEEAREELVDERIDTIIELDPWMDEKVQEFKRSWIAVHADETRPLLTAAVEAVMLQAKQQAVDELIWNYTKRIRDEIIPGILEALDTVESMMEEGELREDTESALDILSPVVPIDEDDLLIVSDMAEIRFEAIMANGTPQEKILLSMINRSAVLGSLRSLAEAKPLLDGAYNLIRYVEPNLERPGVIPDKATGDLLSLGRNLSQITAEQAILMNTLLPMLREDVIAALTEANPGASRDSLEQRADEILDSASDFLLSVTENEELLSNLTSSLADIRVRLAATDLPDLYSQGKALLESGAEMEKWFITSPIYLMEKPLYFEGETKRYVDYISPGIFAFGILFSVLVYTVLSVVRDREKGILSRIFVCNVDRWTYVAGKSIVCMAIAAVQILILTGCAIAIFDIYIASIPKTLVYGLLSSIGFVGVGLLISSISKTELEALTASFGFCFIMLLVSGIFYPFELSPSIVRQASRYVPVTYTADLLKAGIMKDSSLVEVAPDLVAVCIYGGLALIVGALAFNWRKRG